MKSRGLEGPLGRDERVRWLRRETQEDIMARNESTRELKQFRVRHLVKALLAAGTAAVAVLACMQSMLSVLTTLRTRMLATVALASMSAMVAAQAPSDGAPSRPTVNVQIAKTADAFTRAMLAGDARAVAATFTVDGYELPPHHPAVKGRAAIQQRYEAFFKGPIKMTAFAISPIESTIEGDLAYYVGTSTQRLLLPDGKTVTDVGKHIAILKRIQGEWKLAYLTFNSDLPAMPSSSGQ
jgi:uncharacterized protein (TIGR02246 family)